MLLSILFIGIFSALAIYHFLVFLGRRKDLSNLAYSGLCLLFILNLYLTRIYTPSEHFNALVDYFFGGLIPVYSGVCIAIICMSVFDLRGIKKVITLYFKTILTVGNLLLIFFLIWKHLLFILLINGLIGIFDIIFIIKFIIHIKKTKQYTTPFQKILFAGLLNYLIIIGIRQFLILFNMPEQLTVFIVEFAYLFLTITIAFALTYKFNSEYKDLTDLKINLEKKVKQRTCELDQANKEKTNFFINIAHETKTPLTLIENYLNSYMSKINSKRNELHIIKENIDMLKRNMINFMDLEKLKKGHFIYNNNQVISLSNFIKKKIESVSKTASLKNLTLNYKIEESIFINIDPYAIDRILNNLFDNAIKYNKEKGEIYVELYRTGDDVKLIIHDTGIGMSKDKIEHIFEPYYQMNNYKRNIEGLGMGLSIVKEIIDSIHGQIFVESILNNYSKFTIIFKNCKNKEESVHESWEPLISQNQLSPSIELIIKENHYDPDLNTIFIVEDNKNMISFLMENLNDNYNVYYALNGKEALCKLNSIPKPDIIISDIMMDVMDGYSFEEELNKLPEYNTIPFIFLTAKYSLSERIKGLSIGAIDYISKPFVIEELILKIQTIIKISNSLNKKRIIEMEKFILEYLDKEKKGEVPDNNIQPFDLEQVSERLYDQYNITSREIKIISMLVEKLMYKEIAYELNISINTVRTHIKHIYKKLNISSSNELRKIFIALVKTG